MMRIVAVAIALAVVPQAQAQAQAGPVKKQTTGDLVCQLSGDCGADEMAAGKQIEKGKSRGFAIYRPTKGSTPATAARPTTTTPRAVDSRQTMQQPRFGASPSRVAARPAGRAELMINFVSGSARIDGRSNANAMALLGAVNAPQLAGKRFAVEGHTDAVGSRTSNLDLSQRRAQAVVDFLVAHGADASRLDAKGYGFDRPIAGTTALNGRNRRVEIVVK